MRTKVPATSKGWVKWHNCIEKKNFFLFPHADHLIRNPRQTNLHMNTVSFKNVTYFSIICNYCNYFRSISIRKKRTMNQYAYWLIGSESSNTKLNCLYGRSVLYSLFQVNFLGHRVENGSGCFEEDMKGNKTLTSLDSLSNFKCHVKTYVFKQAFNS